MSAAAVNGRLVARDASVLPFERLLSLEGRAAVITGAARGIGLAIARRFAQAGASLLLTDVDETALVAAAAQLGGARVRWAAHDVTDPQATEAVADLAVEELGSLDIWVNNAGVYPPLDPVDVAKDEFQRVLDINVTGVQLGMGAAVRRMRMPPARGGVILNIASTAAFRGHGAYSASKWAVRGLTKGLAPEVGPDGIRVLAIAPSITATPGVQALREAGGAPMRARMAGVAGRIPLGRTGVPDDVARLALFLAGDCAAFMTGVTVVVDGGSLSVE